MHDTVATTMVSLRSKRLRVASCLKASMAALVMLVLAL